MSQSEAVVFNYYGTVGMAKATLADGRTVTVTPEGVVKVISSVEQNGLSKTAIVEVEPEETNLIAAGLLYNLGGGNTKIETRAEMLIGAMITAVGPTLRHLLPEGEATEEDRAVYDAEVLRESMRRIGELSNVAAVAQLRVALQMNKLETRYHNGDGEVKDLADELAAAMPRTSDKGRARQISEFILVSARILLAAGIQPAEISAVLADNRPSKLSPVGTEVRTVFADTSLSKEEKKAQYHQILSDAKVLTVRDLEEKYGKHRFPAAAGSIQRAGAELHLAVWTTPDQFNDQISPLLRTAVNWDSGREDAAITPDMILAGDMEKMFMTAVRADPLRDALLGILSHTGDEAVYIQYVMTALGTRVQPLRRVKEAMADLVRWGLVAEENKTYKLMEREREAHRAHIQCPVRSLCGIRGVADGV